MSEKSDKAFWISYESLDRLWEVEMVSILALLEKRLSISPVQANNQSRTKKIGQALGAWPMPLNGVSPVVPFFPN
jgi:hypothetical protein